MKNLLKTIARLLSSGGCPCCGCDASCCRAGACCCGCGCCGK